MIFTRRGYAVLAVVVLGLANATLYGPRTLHAVVAPAAVALVAGGWLVRRVERPTLERIAVDEGFPGETYTIELRFSTPTAFTGRIHDRVDDGLSATGNELTTSLGETTMAYDVTLDRRGAHELGPVTVTARDVLGLAERTFTYQDRSEIVVFPTVVDLTGRARHELNLLPDLELAGGRGEFDTLREYERGDAYRDIDWKSSAKAPDGELVVKEYVDENDLGEVRIAAETVEEPSALGASEDPARRSADAMAEAAASVAAFLLDAGLSVGVAAPDGAVEPGDGASQRRAVLELLARTGPGTVSGDRRAEADLRIVARGDDVELQLAGEVVPFERLTGATERTAATAEG